MAFKAIKIKVTGEETEINQEKDFEFSDYERELGAVETLNNFPAIYNGKTAMIMTTNLMMINRYPLTIKQVVTIKSFWICQKLNQQRMQYLN